MKRYILLCAALLCSAAALSAPSGMPLLGVGSVGGIAPITAANLTSGASSSSATTYTTASISPTANKLVIVTVATLCTAACNPLTQTVTGAGGTWVQIGQQFSADNSKTVAMFRDLSASPGSGALTLGFNSVSQQKAMWSVDQFGGVDTSGTHGSGAIVQFVGNTDVTSETSFTCTLAALGSTTNAAYGGTRFSAVITLTDNLTNLANQTGTTMQSDFQWGINHTAVTWTFTTSAVAKVCGAVEIKNGT